MLVKCECIGSLSYVIHYCRVRQNFIHADSSTLGSSLGLNNHFVFLCVVYGFTVFVILCVVYFFSAVCYVYDVC